MRSGPPSTCPGCGYSLDAAEGFAASPLEPCRSPVACPECGFGSPAGGLLILGDRSPGAFIPGEVERRATNAWARLIGCAFGLLITALVAWSLEPSFQGRWSLLQQVLCGAAFLVAVGFLVWRATAAWKDTRVAGRFHVAKRPIGLSISAESLTVLSSRALGMAATSDHRPLAYAAIRMHRVQGAEGPPTPMVQLSMAQHDVRSLGPGYRLDGNWDHTIHFVAAGTAANREAELALVLRLAEQLACAAGASPPLVPSGAQPAPDRGDATPPAPPFSAHMRGTEDRTQSTVHGAWGGAGASAPIMTIASLAVMAAVGTLALLLQPLVCGAVFAGGALGAGLLASMLLRRDQRRISRGQSATLSWFSRRGVVVLVREPSLLGLPESLDALILPRVLLDRTGVRSVIHSTRTGTVVAIHAGDTPIASFVTTAPPAECADRLRSLLAHAGVKASAVRLP